MPQNIPAWFRLCEEATPQVMMRIGDAASSNRMSMQSKLTPTLAYWFMCDSLFLANQANRQGMHANALSLTRQCLESLSVIELGICDHPEAEQMVLKWNDDLLSPGKLRGWLERCVWPSYGVGLWNEPWAAFMTEFAAALQPLAHYSSMLSRWQVRLVSAPTSAQDSSGGLTALIEARPRAYDEQKATRITLFHAILTYALGRIWLATNQDTEFENLITEFGLALSKSKYLDGHGTKWGQQFWAMLWSQDGSTILE